MEKLISRRIDIQCVPDSYIQPPELRPGKEIIPVSKNIPVIDVGSSNRREIVMKVLEACQEYGVFQVINHGVVDELMQHMMMEAKDFLNKPVLDDMPSCYSEDPSKSCRLYTSIDYNQEKVHYWKDTLRLPCNPIEDSVQSWPLNPPLNREVTRKYAEELRKLSWWILDIIGEGLGFEAGYFGTNLSEVHKMTLNQYPTCPDPSLTLGFPKHCDFNILTLLQQDEAVVGLQTLVNDKWVGVEPIPNAFVVDVCCTMQVLSNGKLKSNVHRVVTNNVSRISIVTAIHPASDSHIEPAKFMVNSQNPARYRGFIYKELFTTFLKDSLDGKPPMGRYEINSA